MVHCFTYTHKGNPLYFVWDVESGSLHNVDEAAFLVSKKRYQQLSDDENKRFLKLSEADLKEIDAELDLLEKDGVLNAPEVRINLPSSGGNQGDVSAYLPRLQFKVQLLLCKRRHVQHPARLYVV